jgi:aminoglycoside phosphotransferase (APT) family kinase protein
MSLPTGAEPGAVEPGAAIEPAFVEPGATVEPGGPLEPGSAEADIVETCAEAAGLSRPPLLVLAGVRDFLDAHGLGSGALAVSRIGTGGGSNFSFLLERGPERFVLRRPPRPPLPPSAHDVVREARLQLALAPLGIRVPRIRAVCEDLALLGVPFYVYDYVEGFVLTDVLPPGLERDEAARRRLADDLVDALVEIHAVDAAGHELASFVRPGSYLERQLRRFSQLWELNATRPLPLVAELGTRLAASVPEPLAPTVVHGDFRMGNVIVAPGRARPVAAVIDWEMGAVGDPRADVGYLLATYSEPAGEPSPLGTSPVTAAAGFPSRDELASRYAERSGRAVEPLAWFEALALWKAAVFCEAIYGRFERGELTSGDASAAAFEHIVPALAAAASARLSELGR